MRNMIYEMSKPYSVAYSGTLNLLGYMLWYLGNTHVVSHDILCLHPIVRLLSMVPFSLLSRRSVVHNVFHLRCTMHEKQVWAGWN